MPLGEIVRTLVQMGEELSCGFGIAERGVRVGEWDTEHMRCADIAAGIHESGPRTFGSSRIVDENKADFHYPIVPLGNKAGGFKI